MNLRRTTLMGGALAAFALLLNGCFSFRQTVSSISDIGDDQVVVVGRVLMDPQVTAADQHIQWGIGTGMLKNAFLSVGDGPWTDPRPDPGSSGALNQSIKTPWNRWFYVSMPKHDFTVQGLMLYTGLKTEITEMSTDGSSAGTTDVRRADFPADLLVKVLPSDRVIFIGSLVFKRDEFNTPEGVRVYSDYKNVRAKIQERFGSAPVRMALPVLKS